MNLRDLASKVANVVFGATPAGAVYNVARTINPSLPDPVSFVKQAATKAFNTPIPHTLSDFPYYLTRPQEYQAGQLSVSPIRNVTLGSYMTGFPSLPSPQEFVQKSAKVVLENVLPSIGVTPLPKPTGWSLPRAITTTGAFTGLQKLAGYSNEQILDPVNLGLSFAAGGLKFNEPARQQANIRQELPAPTTQREAVQRLNNLLHPQDQYRELMARGYSKEQIKTISAPEFLRIVKEDIPPFMHDSFQPTNFEAKGMLGKAWYQASENQPLFNKLFSKWIGQRQKALTTGVEYGSRYKDIPMDQAAEIIKYMENPNVSVSEQARVAAAKLRTEFNLLYNDAKTAGFDVGYLKDYLYHIWSDTPEQVAQKYQTLGQKFSGHRVVPTYAEGIEMGLTPKYTHPAQILAEYVRKLETVKANVDFLKQLKKEGFVVTAGVGAKTPGFVQIRAPGFPQNTTIIAGQKKVIGGYYAPAQVANVINQIFNIREAPKGLRISSNISSKIQDVTLSGGVPGTPINAWTAAQVIKEVTAGRIRGPITAIVRSMINPEGYFKENAQFIKEQQANNIPVRSTYNIENLVPKGILEGNLWNKLVNTPTFQKFMPILQTEFYKDIRNNLVHKGIAQETAIETAAKATKNFYGIITSDIQVKQSPTAQAVKSTFLFAPHYRTTMINFWLNSLKALKNPLAPENINNTRFIVGAVITYFAMDQANRYFNNGRPMYKNPSGSEDKLLIPVGNGDVVGVPYLSSIATVPRGLYRQGTELLKGNISGAATDALQTYLSSGVKPLADVMANRDYFGKEISPEGATPAERYKAIGNYLLTQYISHPYLKEIFDKRNQEDPAYQRLSRAMEMPFRFYTEKSLEGKYYYSARDEALSKLTSAARSAYDAIPKYDTNDPNSTILKYQIYLTYPEVFKVKQQTEMEMFARTGQPIDPLYLVDFETAKKYMRYETLMPGSQDRKDMTKAYPELVALFDVRGKYFDENPLPSTTGQNRPIASQAVQDAMDRKDWNYPGVREYLDANREYQNQQRIKLGLPMLPEYGSGYAQYARKPKTIKIALKKAPKIKIGRLGKSKSLKTIKIKKPPKSKKIKIKSLYQLAIRPNRILRG